MEKEKFLKEYLVEKKKTNSQLSDRKDPQDIVRCQPRRLHVG